jgi:TfoX/Sxy family transcriptional regulator of competence genes
MPKAGRAALDLAARLADALAAGLPATAPIEREAPGRSPQVAVHGHVFAAVHGERLVLRLGDAARHELLKLPGARVFEPREGHPQREHVVVPMLVLTDPAALAHWLRRAFDHTAALPVRKRRAATAREKT